MNYYGPYIFVGFLGLIGVGAALSESDSDSQSESTRKKITDTRKTSKPVQETNTSEKENPYVGSTTGLNAPNMGFSFDWTKTNHYGYPSSYYSSAYIGAPPASRIVSTNTNRARDNSEAAKSIQASPNKREEVAEAVASQAVATSSIKVTSKPLAELTATSPVTSNPLAELTATSPVELTATSSAPSLSAAEITRSPQSIEQFVQNYIKEYNEKNPKSPIKVPNSIQLTRSDENKKNLINRIKTQITEKYNNENYDDILTFLRDDQKEWEKILNQNQIYANGGAGQNDCLIISILTLFSDSFRKCIEADRNKISNAFRRVYLSSILKDMLRTVVDQKHQYLYTIDILTSQEMLNDDWLNLISKYFNLNIHYINTSDDKPVTIRNINSALEDIDNEQAYMIINYGDYHFEPFINTEKAFYNKDLRNTHDSIMGITCEFQIGDRVQYEKEPSKVYEVLERNNTGDGDCTNVTINKQFMEENFETKGNDRHIYSNDDVIGRRLTINNTEYAYTVVSTKEIKKIDEVVHVHDEKADADDHEADDEQDDDNEDDDVDEDEEDEQDEDDEDDEQEEEDEDDDVKKAVDVETSKPQTQPIEIIVSGSKLFQDKLQINKKGIAIVDPAGPFLNNIVETNITGGAGGLSGVIYNQLFRNKENIKLLNNNVKPAINTHKQNQKVTKTNITGFYFKQLYDYNDTIKITVYHVSGPNLNGESQFSDDNKHILGTLYDKILNDYDNDKDLDTLMIAPISGSIFAGKFKKNVFQIYKTKLDEHPTKQIIRILYSSEDLPEYKGL